jgi:predicted enzyme related to lactoylglutathione lyase
MARVLGIGGVFVKAANPDVTRAWYRDVLGLDASGTSGAIIRAADDPQSDQSYCVWSIFAADSDYFGPSGQGFMVNLRVDDLDGVLARAAAAGVAPAKPAEIYPYGRFAWLTDPDGIRIELWQPSQA